MRDLIMTRLDENMLVEAAAGTGKTTSIVGRMVRLLASGACADIRGMVAVTFTRNAAAELKTRFRIALERSVREKEGIEGERLAEALAHVDQCFVGTIHSFCGRLLRERPVEAGVDIAFEEIDDETDSFIREECWREYCAGLTAGAGGTVLSDLAAVGVRAGQLERGFKEFAMYPDVDDWPLPEAGTALEGGYSRDDLAAYISYSSGVELDGAVALLEEYVGRMRETAPGLPDDSGNDRLIPAFKEIPRVASHYEDLSEPRQLMELLEEQFDRGLKVVQKVWVAAGFSREAAKAEQARWDEFRETVVLPMLGAWREARYGPAMRVFLEARSLYDARRAELGVLNFQDLLMKSAELLKDNPHVRRYFAHRFTHLLVDEFQDTDPIQAEVIMLITATDPDETDWRRCRPRPGSLFVVGDPKQSIYRFRRADIVTYNEVKEMILSGGMDTAPGVLVNLSANFRSTGPLIDWVNGVFQPGSDGEEDVEGPLLRFPASSTEESPAYVALARGRDDAAQPGTCLSGIHALVIEDEVGNREDAFRYEADLIARFIRYAVDSGLTIPRRAGQLERGRSEAAEPGDFMVISRNRAHLSAYAAALQRYGVPHQVTGGTVLNEVEELGFLLACVEAVLRPDDPVALLGALRSEAFGVSDASLYRYKKAGGRFDYRTVVPKTLGGDDRDAFAGAFEKLGRYAGWFAGIPPVSAVEAMLEDLGLTALAGARPGGEFQAGGLGKTVELLRGIQHEQWSGLQLAEYLSEIVSSERQYDAVSARPQEAPPVRVMNLHKVKGLEAPVVFLASAYGDSDHPVDLFVDRSGDRVLGYMAVRAPDRGRRKGGVLAQPRGWETLAERERRFQTAEELRLRYVAATRCSEALVVTQRSSQGRNRNNAWRHFKECLPPEILNDPGPAGPPLEQFEPVTLEESTTAAEKIESRLEGARLPTYRVSAAKEHALARAGGPISQTPSEEGGPEGATGTAPDGEHGVEWGQVIHGLLELAMGGGQVELLPWARTLLEENGLERSSAKAAVETAESVIASPVWARAAASGSTMTEVPFEVALPGEDRLTLVRGVIDLVFREEGGWVIVDYKTDEVRSPGHLDELTSKYAPQLILYSQAWEMATGEPVVETGLFFVGVGEFRPVPTGPGAPPPLESA
jgi:ATP-dependent helicase/nuclease subunit A